MGKGYQDRDAEIIDYRLWNLKGVGAPLRGPEPASLNTGDYISCVGATQTFGCYAEHPYPALLGARLDTSILNLGMSGAGPSFFTTRPNFLSVIDEGRITVVQVMSGRSVSNHLFQSKGREMLTRRVDGETKGAAPMYRDLLETRDFRLISQVLHETRQQWVDDFTQLLDRIRSPKILFWLSVRAPEYSASLDDVHRFFGEFPQLVNREMVDFIRPLCDDYVECTTDVGMPQRLYSRRTGEPVEITKRADLGGGTKAFNDYYPSPEMHEAGAAMLHESIIRIMP